MPKFRKKPIIVEAEQWFPDKPVEGVVYPAKVYDGMTGEEIEGVGYIETLEGIHIVSPGDWIITGVRGEKYPCKADVFETTYEPVEG